MKSCILAPERAVGGVIIKSWTQYNQILKIKSKLHPSVKKPYKLFFPKIMKKIGGKYYLVAVWGSATLSFSAPKSLSIRRDK